MKFKINGNTWTIKEISKDKFSLKDVLGESCFEQQEIHLLDTCKSKRNTLKHELCHVWMWEYAHAQTDDIKYNYEQVCEIVASSNDFINEIVNKYFK